MTVPPMRSDHRTGYTWGRPLNLNPWTDRRFAAW
jgi:hypothetical protein